MWSFAINRLDQCPSDYVSLDPIRNRKHKTARDTEGGVLTLHHLIDSIRERIRFVGLLFANGLNKDLQYIEDLM